MNAGTVKLVTVEGFFCLYFPILYNFLVRKQAFFGKCNLSLIIILTVTSPFRVNSTKWNHWKLARWFFVVELAKIKPQHEVIYKSIYSLVFVWLNHVLFDVISIEKCLFRLYGIFILYDFQWMLMFYGTAVKIILQNCCIEIIWFRHLYVNCILLALP